jgi:hypothetical protein
MWKAFKKLSLIFKGKKNNFPAVVYVLYSDI